MGLTDAVDLVDGDGEDDADLISSAVPRVGATEVALGQFLDVLGSAVGAVTDDPTADLKVPGRVARVGHIQRHPGVTLNIAVLLESLHGVDQARGSG